MASVSNLCQNCNARPQFYDTVAGKQHSFCSKGCALANASSASSVSIPSANTNTNTNGNSAPNCEQCRSRPKHWDGTQLHPYCGKSCAQAAKLVGGSPPKRRGTVGTPPATNTPAAPVSTVGLCTTPGCSKPVFKDASGKASKYCSKSHKVLAATGCLHCNKVAKVADSHFCQPCQAIIEANAPMIVEVPEEHETFKSVASQFEKSWRHQTSCPTVRAVYKVISTQQNLDKYEAYKDSVEARGQFLNANRTAGNENRRWHGTGRQCDLGDKGCTLLCSSQSCSLCCIVRTSYDLNLFGKKTGWGRFGSGIYTSSTSSKSNDYSKNTSSSKWKAVLLNKVVVGKGYKMLRDSPLMTAPPAGYDSVLAEVGGTLKYDELVVYNDDAVRPSYLVMYDKPT